MLMASLECFPLPLIGQVDRVPREDWMGGWTDGQKDGCSDAAVAALPVRAKQQNVGV